MQEMHSNSSISFDADDIEASINNASSTLDDEDISNTDHNIEDFSSDIEPVRFKMMKPRDASRSNNKKSSRSNLLQLKQLIKGSSTIPSNIKPQIFHYIDVDQFENYLKEPKYIKILKKTRHVKEFRRLFLAQELKINDPEGNTNTQVSTTFSNQSASTHHTGSESKSAISSKAIWKTKFSLDGKYMAAGCKDGSIRIWKVICSPIERLELNSQIEPNMVSRAKTSIIKNKLSNDANSAAQSSSYLHSSFDQHEKSSEFFDLYAPVFHPTPIRVFKEHTHDILDLNWSKNNFIVTSSMDKTVKVWHPDRKASLKTFHHPDFVTSVCFHPTDDRFFISGCLDHKCRLWSIVDDEVCYEFDSHDLITSVAFSPDDGKLTIIGTFNGYLYTLLTDSLKPLSSFHISDRKTQIRDSSTIYPDPLRTHNGPRVTGLTTFIAPIDKSLRILVTSNDSRIRVFNLNTKNMLEIIKGFHGGVISHSAELGTSNGIPYIMCGSDDHWIYGWRLKSSIDDTISDSKKNKGSLKPSDSLKNLFHRSNLSRSSSQSSRSGRTDELAGLAMTNLNGSDKTYAMVEGGKSESNHRHSFISSLMHGHHRSYVKNSRYLAFHAHSAPVTSVSIAPEGTGKLLSLSDDVIYELTSEFSNENDEFDFFKLKNQQGCSSDSTLDLDDHNNSPSSLLNSVKAIGSICVSADSSGVIRVFRTDVPTAIRRRILRKLQEYKHDLQGRVHSSSSLQTLANSSRRNSSLNVNRTKSFTTISNLTTVLSTGQNGTSVATKLMRPGLKSSSNTNSNSMSTKNSFAKEVPSIGGMANIYSCPNQNFPSSFVSELPQSINCDVCHGKNFKKITKGKIVKSDNSYYCIDCGNVLNNFR